MRYVKTCHFLKHGFIFYAASLPVVPFQCWPLGNFGNSVACISFIAPNVHEAYSRLLLHSTVCRAAHKGGNNLKQCHDVLPVANFSFAKNTSLFHLKKLLAKNLSLIGRPAGRSLSLIDGWYTHGQQFMILALLYFMAVLEWVMVFSIFFSQKTFQIHSKTEFNTALVLHYKFFTKSRPLNWLLRECR